MSVCFSGSLLSASIHCIHCNIAQKINFWLIDWYSSQGTVRVPWLSIAKSVPMYALIAAHFTNNFGYYTLLTCLPQYFKHILRFDIKSVSLSAVIFSFVNWCWPTCLRCKVISVLFSPLGKPADRAIYFTCINFFFFTLSKAISGSTGPIFTIVSPKSFWSYFWCFVLCVLWNIFIICFSIFTGWVNILK